MYIVPVFADISVAYQRRADEGENISPSAK